LASAFFTFWMAFEHGSKRSIKLNRPRS